MKYTINLWKNYRPAKKIQVCFHLKCETWDEPYRKHQGNLPIFTWPSKLIFFMYMPWSSVDQWPILPTSHPHWIYMCIKSTHVCTRWHVHYAVNCSTRVNRCVTHNLTHKQWHFVGTMSTIPQDLDYRIATAIHNYNFCSTVVRSRSELMGRLISHRN